MGKTLQYVKEFDFGPAGKTVGKMCGGSVKKAYATGGEVKAAVHKHEKAMHPGKPMTKLAKGGKAVVEKATGERYPSRKAMVKHEASESPREQREELIQKASVKAPMPRRRMPVAPAEPMIPLKKGGAARCGR